MAHERAARAPSFPADLAAIYDPPNPVVLDKVKASLDTHAGGFLLAARMAVLNLRGRDGRPVPLMVGTASGAIRVASPTRVELPLPQAAWPRERSGCPVGETARLGALFIVPGVKETLRMQGHGRVCPSDRDDGLLLRIEVEAVFFHCAKAFMRSRVWDAQAAAPGLRSPV